VLLSCISGAQREDGGDVVGSGVDVAVDEGSDVGVGVGVDVGPAVAPVVGEVVGDDALDGDAAGDEPLDGEVVGDGDVGPADGLGVLLALTVGVGDAVAGVQLAVPLSVKDCPAMGLKCQS
jgi:hypothetical protein